MSHEEEDRMAESMRSSATVAARSRWPSPAAATTTTTAAAAAAAAAATSKAGKVAVLLPDSKSSVRWETVDRPFLKEAFDAAGVEVEIQNAEGDKSTQQQQAEQAITNGAKVLLLVNLDSGSGAAIAANAKSQGVKVIDYDRLTLERRRPTTTSRSTTRRSASSRARASSTASATRRSPAVAVLNGSPTDNNATLFKNGYDSVINPKFESGDWTEVDDQSVPDWDNQKALTIFEQMLQKADNKIDGVLAANDGLGNAAISALKQRKLDADPGHRPGRDAAGHPEHRRRRPVHDGLQGDQEGGRRGRRARDRAGQGRDARRRRDDGRQRAPRTSRRCCSSRSR